ncbi:MAG: glycosyltransferase [Vampirovibrionales bacterium]
MRFSSTSFGWMPPVMAMLLSRCAVPVLLLMGAWLWGAPSWADFSMLDLATQFEEGLSRPMFPEVSLWLPFWLQIAISVVACIVMAVVFTTCQKQRPLVMLVVIALTTRYLLWRTFETLTFKTPESTLVGYIIYGAEILSFLTLLLGYFQMVGQTNRPAKPLEPNEYQPSVDVFLCTYNEPINVIYRSLVGCQAIDYANKQVYLLDDSDRPEMAELAKKLGVHYIARSENKHAKAGNLNNALPQTQGDLVAVFDADHVPARRFIKDIVGYFNDARMAFVQTPQHFFTPDPFQRNLLSEDVMNNEQDLFFHVIEPGNDYWGAAFFAGSGAMFRRKALQEIGGFAVETITEDVHTGLRLHAKGWKSAYYNKDLSAGMAQDSFSDFVKQRIRWGRGMAQILFFDNPIFAGGLSLAQRLCYFAGIWYFFFGAARLIFLLVPLTYLYFGIKPIDAGIVEIVTFFGPAFLASTFGYTVLSHGLRHTFWAEVYETATCVYMFQTNILTLLFPWRAKFRVTPKEGLNDGMSFNWAIVFPQIVIGFLIAFGLGFAVVRAMADPGMMGGILTNVFWSIYNLALIIGAVYVAQERPQFRLSPRIYRQVRCELRLLDDTIAVGYTTNISESGVAVVFDQPIPVSGTLSLKLLDWDLDELSVYQVQAVRSSRDDNGRFYVGFRVVNRTDEQHQSLIRHMFSDARVWRKYHRESTTGKSFGKWLATPMRLAQTKETAARRRTLRVRQNLPCVVMVGGDRIQGFSDQISETGVAVVVRDGAHQLAMGQVVDVMMDWSQQEAGRVASPQTVRAEIKRVVPLGGGQTLFGMNFVDLPKEERLTIIRNLYQDAEDVVRVAPVIAMQVATTLQTVSGVQLDAVTQEISEMGAVLRIRGGSQALHLGDTLTTTFDWPSGSGGNGQKTTYQAVVKDIAEAPDGTPGLVLVYFKNLDLRSLDVLSRCLHQSAA